MMTNIYDQHASAFKNVQAFNAFKITDSRISNEIKVAFKFPKDGAGRLYCYVHLIGTPMVRGMASGYGYDKKTAAMMDAVSKLYLTDKSHPSYKDLKKYNDEVIELQTSLRNAESRGYDGALRNAGYTILQTV